MKLYHELTKKRLVFDIKPEPQMVKPFYCDLEKYSVGVAQIGRPSIHNHVNPKFKVRRVIQIRSRFGICSYYYYRGDDKGKQVFNIAWYHQIKETTREVCAKIRMKM